MRGRIRSYFPDRGFGFISDSDGNDYFFHIKSVVAHREDIETGCMVEFEPSVGTKGPVATGISLLQKEKKFIVLDEHRIRLANIKTYSIEDEQYSVKEKTEKSSIDKTMDAGNTLINVLSYVVTGRSEGIPTTPDSRMVTKTRKVLRVRTYQNETYSISEEDGDIESILRDIDRYFGVQ